MHYYAFHIADYISHTKHLSLMEDIAYRRLLDLYYLHEVPLFGSVSFIARLIGMREHEDDVSGVLAEFFDRESEEDGSDRWVNPRAARELAEYAAKREAASRAGKASANARSTTVQRCAFNDRSTTVQPTSNQEPRTSTQEPVQKQKALAVARPGDVSEETWEEWVRFRKTKRAPVTNLVLRQTRKAATEAGMSMEIALTYWVANGQTGFFPPKKVGANGRPMLPPEPQRNVATVKPFEPIIMHESGNQKCPCENCYVERQRKAAQ